MVSMNRTRALWLLSSIFFILAFLHPLTEILIFPAFLFLLRALTQSTSAIQVMRHSLMLGTIKGLGVLLWIWNIYPLSWLTDHSAMLQIATMTVYWLTAALTLALGTTVAITCVYLCHKHLKKGLYTLPFLWLAGELIGALLYSVLTLGPGSSIQMHFSYGFVGYTIANFPLLNSIATFGGVYTLTLLVATLALLIHVYTKQEKMVKKITTFNCVTTLVTCVILFTAVHHYTREIPVHNLSVIAVSTNIDKTFMPGENNHAARRTVAYEATTQALTLSPDVIILPEDLRMLQGFTSLEEIFELLGDTLLIDSARTNIEQGVISRAYIFNPDEQTAYALDKNYLVPHGEYMPYLHNALLRPFLSSSTALQLAEDLAYTTGKPNKYTNFPDDTPVILSCMESAWPGALYKRTRDHTPPFVAHTISHSWFHKPTILWHQQDRMLQAQALWSNTTIITAPNMAPQKVYRPSGSIEQGKPIAETTYWALHVVKI